MKSTPYFALSACAKAILYFLMAFLPMWGVIVAQLGYYLGGRDFFTATRYMFVFLLLFVFLILALLNLRRVVLSKWVGLLTFYVFYVLLHFVGDAGYVLFVEGLRHEIVYALLAWTIILCGTVVEPASFMPDIKRFRLLILVNGFISVFFAVWQFYDISILEKLYRGPLSEMRNIHLAAGERLTSTLINPINFGAFVAIFFLAGASFSKARWQVLVLFVISTVLIVGSMSRLALVAHFVAASLYFSLAQKVYVKLISLFFVSLFLIVLIAFSDRVAIYDDRLARMYTLLEVSTFEENARVNSWYSAVKDMDNIEVLWGKGAGASSPTVDGNMASGAVVIENTFITVYYQYGVIGLVVFVMIILRFLSSGLVIKRFDESSGQFFLGFWAVFVIMSLGNDFIRNLPFSFCFWMAYAYAEIMRRRSERGGLV